MIIALVYMLVLALLIAVLLLTTELRKKKELLAYANADLEVAHKRESVTNRQLGDVFCNISPLLSETDWMTGRWGGQFATLVQMENSRNAVARGIKTQLLRLPYLKEYINENKVALHMGSLQDGLTAIQEHSHRFTA